MDRGVEIGHGDGLLEDVFREFIGHAVGAVMFQTSAREDETEGGALMPAPSASIVGGGTSELGADGDEGLVEQLLLLEIDDQRGEGDVELLDEAMLVLLALVVGVPTGAVDEIEVVRDLDEPDPGLDEAAGKETTLPELPPVEIAQIRGLFLEIEMTHEVGSGEA